MPFWPSAHPACRAVARIPHQKKHPTPGSYPAREPAHPKDPDISMAGLPAPRVRTEPPINPGGNPIHPSIRMRSSPPLPGTRHRGEEAEVAAESTLPGCARRPAPRIPVSFHVPKHKPPQNVITVSDASPDFRTIQKAKTPEMFRQDHWQSAACEAGIAGIDGYPQSDILPGLNQYSVRQNREYDDRCT